MKLFQFFIFRKNMGKKIRIIIGVIQNNWNNVPRIVNLFKSTFFSKKTKINYLPIGADIEPTIACNLDCIMCHQKELLAKRKSISMSFDNFKKIIDKLPTLVKINLQGMGEPFANKDFVSMVEYSKKKKIYVTTITNGLLLDKNKIKEIVSSGLDRIYFSIDTTDKEKYQFYRGKKGDLEKLIANLEELIKERKLQNKKYLEIGIWMLLFENNIDQLFPMVKMAKKIGVDKLTAQTELTYRGKSNWKENIEKIRFKKMKAIRPKSRKLWDLQKKSNSSWKYNQEEDS